MIGSPNYPEASGGLLPLQSLSHHTSRWLGWAELRRIAEGHGVFVNMWPWVQNVTADPCIVSHCTHLKKVKTWWKLVPFAELNPRPGMDTCSVLIPHSSRHSPPHLFLWWGVGRVASTSAASSKECQLVAASSGTFICVFSRGEISQMTCAFQFYLANHRLK